MTEEENKAIENFEKRLIIEKYTKNIGTPVYIKDIEIILNLVQKLQKENEEKDKIIDLMAKTWKQDDVRSIEEIKQYFKKQAKEV